MFCAIVALTAGTASAGEPLDLWLTLLHDKDGESRRSAFDRLPTWDGTFAFGPMGVTRFKNILENADALNLTTPASSYPESGEGRIVHLDFTSPVLGCKLADIAGPNGALDADDLLAYLTAFSANSSVGDVSDADGTLDIDDVMLFPDQFAQGCP